MKGLFGLVGLVAALAVVAWVAKRQLDAVAPVPAGAVPVSGALGNSTVPERAQSLQQRTRQTVDGLMQQPRPQADGQ
jgi:hypothetical protein